NRRYLNSLSLVSKQFLSITNRFLFSLTVYDGSTSFLGLLKRFTNLNSLALATSFYFNTEVDKILIKISCFPLKLTSLSLPHYCTIPADGLRSFSQNITTLTSLTCYQIRYLNTSDLFLIAECFPLLQELDFSYPSDSGYKNYSSYEDGVKAISLALIKLRKVNLSGFPINNQSLFHLFNNCKYLEEVIMFDCDEITNEGIASALRERPGLRSLSFSATSSNPEYREMFATSHLIDSLVSLKSLTCLALHNLNISDELLNSIAREGLPLMSLDLQSCTDYSFNGIFYLLSKCQHIQHLGLESAYFLEDQHVVQLSSLLRDLVSINLTCCQLTKSALFTLANNCPSLSEINMEMTGENVVGNSDSLGKLCVYPQLKALYLGKTSWLSDESIIMFASIFPNLELLDLNLCNDISEGICEVLRKCYKLRHLNLAYCPRVKLHGLNFVVPKLEVLDLSNTKVDDETLYVISKNCPGLLQLLLEHCNDVTEKGVKHLAENCTQLRKIKIGNSSHVKDALFFTDIRKVLC
ncbi:F-box/LRR-repeat protein, partial [Trifolium pratense]